MRPPRAHSAVTSPHRGGYERPWHGRSAAPFPRERRDDCASWILHRLPTWTARLKRQQEGLQRLAFLFPGRRRRSLCLRSHQEFHLPSAADTRPFGPPRRTAPYQPCRNLRTSRTTRTHNQVCADRDLQPPTPRPCSPMPALRRLFATSLLRPTQPLAMHREVSIRGRCQGATTCRATTGNLTMGCRHLTRARVRRSPRVFRHSSVEEHHEIGGTAGASSRRVRSQLRRD
jgi:hypothetical protein